MAQVYSTYEAKARFSEVVRKVRAGKRIVITYRGKGVAEIRPLQPAPSRLEARLARLEADGILGPYADRSGSLKPVARIPGALAAFLEERE